MSLTGQRLSHYDIIEEISRGGMGVVYRALDVNLAREVAVNVLPEQLLPARAQIYERRGDAAAARAQYTRFLGLWRGGDVEPGWVAEAEQKVAAR